MDLIDTLRKKKNSIQAGDYTPGLNAVLIHIETAFKHLSRGQETADETAFTDAIYRTNQAFEGSIKEAFRVLAGKDPEKKTIFEIENFLEREHIFRERVLKQLTNYRTEWRNPSTHDYRLDFDFREAFLAAISVTGFACLLFEEISEKIAFNSATKETDLINKGVTTENGTIAENTAKLIIDFYTNKAHTHLLSELKTERELIGALHAFFHKNLTGYTIEVDKALENGMRPDFLITKNTDTVVIEVKRTQRNIMPLALEQVTRYIKNAGANNGIILLSPATIGAPMKIDKIVSPENSNIYIIAMEQG